MAISKKIRNRTPESKEARKLRKVKALAKIATVIAADYIQELYELLMLVE